MNRHLTHQIFKPLVAASCFLAAAGLLLYVLALIALGDLERPVPSRGATNVRGSLDAAVGAAGPLLVSEGNRQVAEIPRQRAQFVSADYVSNRTALLTTTADGATQLVRLDVTRRLDALSQALADKLWIPYGAPIAQVALWLVSQAVPLHVPQTRQGRRGRFFRDCPDCPHMVEIEPCIVFLGATLLQPQRRTSRQLVTVARAFAVGRFSVTFEEWDVCVAAGGCAHQPGDEGWGRGRRPVIGVSWNDAVEYVRWLSTRTGKNYRLLRDTEREYVTRAGTTTAYWWGDRIGSGMANCNDCGSQWDNKSSAPVGSFQANAFGLYDVHGNVWEWVADCSSAIYAAPIGSAEGDACSSRILSGGSWMDKPGELSAGSHLASAPTRRDRNFGFRVARSIN